VTIQLGCTDADGDPLTLSIDTPPAHGSLGAIDQANRRVTYTPAAGFTGADAFQFTATDGHVSATAARVTLTVTKPVPSPTPTPSPSPTPTPGPGPGPGTGLTKDTTAPALTLSAAGQKLKAVLAGGVAVRWSCNEPCTVAMQLVLDKATARKLKLGKKALVVGALTTAGGPSAATGKIKLAAKLRKALKRSPAAIKLTLRGIATDTAGNAAVPLSRKVGLRK
jgi:hypothetical protein